MTDHMILASYDPLNGWSAPEIKPYGPITLMPASSCFQYATNAFEGMKVSNKCHVYSPRFTCSSHRSGLRGVRRHTEALPP